MTCSLYHGLLLALFIGLLCLGDRAEANRPPGVPDGCVTRCHRSKALQDVVHGPVKSDECLLCHVPTGKGEHAKQPGVFRMAAEGAQLCAICHESKSTRKVVHAPVAAGDCRVCHDVHQSPFRVLLKAEGSALCLQCHKDVSTHRHTHGPVAAGECLSCHDAHQSDYRALLKGAGGGLCFGCHDKKLASGVSIHGPVGKGVCSACHTPHGSDYPKILRGSFPEVFYLPYSRDNYTLCFGCHTNEIAQDKRTDTLTGFRNGDANLHYLHVNRPDKGRSCKTCHDPHAAEQPRLIKRQIPHFGNWSIPIGFTKTATGGTCVAGCHKPKSYDRLRTVRNP